MIAKRASLTHFSFFLCKLFYLPFLSDTLSLFYLMFLGGWGLNIWLAAQLQFGAAGVYWAGGISDAACTVFCLFVAVQLHSPF